MLNFAILIALYLLYHSYCLCHTTYELDIQGEAQHGYYITLFVGTPPQKIDFLIDTGSSNLAVAALPPLKGSNMYFRYNDSYTFNKSSITIELYYVEGHWCGFLGTDFLDLSKSNVWRKRNKYTIACMVSIDHVFDTNSMFGGLLGLAYSSIASPNSSTIPFFDSIVQLENVSNVFAVSLCGPYFSSKEVVTSCGKLHLGYTSNDQFSGEIIYTPIVKEQFYAVTLTDLKVGKRRISTECKEFNKPRSIIDSGTTRLHLPKLLYHRTILEIKKSVKESIPSKFWFNESAACVPKDNFNISFFPVVTVSFYHTRNSSFDLQISPEHYLLPWVEPSYENNCFLLGFGVSDFGTIIGSTILKGYYVIFDRSNKQIGFANSTTLNNPSSVTCPKYTSENIDLCKYEDGTGDTGVTVGTVICLVIAMGIAVLLLYMLSAWIHRYLIERSGYNSDTRSLVDD